MNISEVTQDIFTKGSVIASLHDTSGKIPHLIGKTMIKPFKTEMKNANNIELFLDANNNITGGQIGLYTEEKGIHIIMF